jgi:hypothetical protein
MTCPLPSENHRRTGLRRLSNIPEFILKEVCNMVKTQYPPVFSDFYGVYIPQNKYFGYSDDLDSYIDKRDPRFEEVIADGKTFYRFSPKTYISNFENRKDILLVWRFERIFKNIEYSELKAIISFYDEKKYEEFIETPSISFLKHKLKLGNRYFNNVIIDVKGEYLKQLENDENRLYREMTKADFFLIR